MTSGSPVRHILQFALPLILGYILQQVYLITDAAIVGRFLGVNELAAVGASSSIMFLIMGFCNGSCAGFAIPVSQAFGAQDFQRMRRYVWNALFLAAIITLVLTLVCSLLCSWILHRVSTPAEIFHEAWLFLLIQFLSIPFTIAYNLLGSFIRALGNSKTPFLILIISSLYNAVLAFVLIVVLKMGVEGSALATMVSLMPPYPATCSGRAFPWDCSFPSPPSAASWCRRPIMPWVQSVWQLSRPVCV